MSHRSISKPIKIKGEKRGKKGHVERKIWLDRKMKNSTTERRPKKSSVIERGKRNRRWNLIDDHNVSETELWQCSI